MPSISSFTMSGAQSADRAFAKPTVDAAAAPSSTSARTRPHLAPAGGGAAQSSPPSEAEPRPNGTDFEALEWARRAQRGEKSAQSVILARLDHPLRTTLQRLLGGEDDFEDLLQDVWLQVFRSLPSYRGQSELSSWAERIAVRTAFRYLRTRLRRKAIASSSTWQRQQDVLDSRPLPGSDPEPNADAREAVRRLQALLDSLKPLYRAAFVSFELDGKSLREVAARTGSSLPATKSRIIRARRRIAKVARTDELLGEYIANSRRWTGVASAASRALARAEAIESVGARTRSKPHRAR